MIEKTSTITANGHSAPALLPAAPPTFSEAPASVNVKFGWRGYNDILLTLRGTSGMEVLTKLGAALDKLEQMGAQPGTGRGGPATATGDAPQCQEHGKPMKQGKRGWFCPQIITEVQGKKIYCKHTA